MMPEPRIFRPLFFCGVSVLALTISASHSLSAQAAPAAQPEVPPDAKAYREAIRLPDPQRRVEAPERFLIDYPQSRYLAYKLADKQDSESPITWELKAETPARPLKLGETFAA